jgi:hypothetical protein
MDDVQRSESKDYRIIKLVNSSNVFVSVEALCVRDGDTSSAIHTLEGHTPAGPILAAFTLDDAIQYFLCATDIIVDIREVRSFKVDGHELLHTFLT